jgi:hypothetical protein
MRRAWAALLLAAAAGLAGAAEPILTPPEQRRGAEQTYLTFPEWYLVHSPAEMASYFAADRPPSQFPWGGHIAQFWQGYRAVTHETADQPFNAGYHLMVFVIGASTTIEYALRACYEGTIGRLAEASSDGRPTAEERLAATVAQQYVDFIRVDPWYRFDFVAPLRRLWADTPPTGANLLRKWERRFALTTEYALKAGYAWLIQLATRSIYDEARPTTVVVVDRDPKPLGRGLTQPERLDGGSGGGHVLSVPRYRAFMFHAQALAEQGVAFREIAGNRGPILVSLLVRSDAPAPQAPERSIFSQPILTQPGWERRVVTVPVPELSAALRRWRAADQQVEHVYDY